MGEPTGERGAGAPVLSAEGPARSADLPPQGPARRDAAFAAALVVVLTLSIQTGSALAVRVIESVGVFEALWLRTAFAALILIIVRPGALRRLPPKGHRLPLAALAVTLFLMNLSFYGAISLVPVGIVVAIEFVGPLGVAVLGTRNRLDWLWIALAGAGVVVLAGPSGSATGLGLLLALSAGICWGVYLLLAKRAVTGMDPLSVTALMMVGATVLATPLLAIDGVRLAGHWNAIALGIVIAVVSSAFPYWLEMVAIRRVRAATYGVLLSIEPAVAALAALAVLGQRISPLEAAAMGAVMAAAAGASWTSGGAAEAGVELPAP
ncbi:MAG TPA: EamA family transporter [Thermoleophilia bacterium]|nr:EamA family transporter [Thermoleophilia bacterium]